VVSRGKQKEKGIVRKGKSAVKRKEERMRGKYK
jgi:hypothetical protein